MNFEVQTHVETFEVHMGPEWDQLMMRLEEHADPTEGMLLTGLELDLMEELHRRVGQLMDVGMLYGREREERLLKRIDAKQEEWDIALKEVMVDWYGGGPWRCRGCGNVTEHFHSYCRAYCGSGQGLERVP